MTKLVLRLFGVLGKYRLWRFISLSLSLSLWIVESVSDRLPTRAFREPDWINHHKRPVATVTLC